MFNLPKPQLVVFDLDNTLYDYEKPNKIAYQSLVTSICTYNKVEHELVVDALSIGRDKVKERLGNTAASHSRLLYLVEAFRILGIKPQVSDFLQLEELFWEVFLSEMELFPGVKDLIKVLKIESIPIALVTDLTSNIQYRKLVKLGLDGLFDSIVTSEEAGGDKVSGLPFKLLEEITEISPTHTWFFGDSNYDFPKQVLTKAIFLRKVETATLMNTDYEIQYDDYLNLIKNVILKN